MKPHGLLLIALAMLLIAAQSAATDTMQPAAALGNENLGLVSFPVSCSQKVLRPFNRGVALLHDFWYVEAQRQFQQIADSSPECAMAHWGIALSLFHQIWDRPDDKTTARGWTEMKAARAHVAKTARERAYISALSEFFRPDKRDYQARIDRYSAALNEIYDRYPNDTDAGAFYALSLLAAKAPSDTSLIPEHKAMTVLIPLFAKFPDHPGVVHYIIHACDTPSMAADGLAAARHYGAIAPSGPHAVHMPGHIFARLGLWSEDIDANLGSVAASRSADARNESGWMDQFHSDDFLVYAYLQSGQEIRAREIAADADAAIQHYQSMPDMAPDRYMVGMFPYYRVKLPIFIALEVRDWASALKLAADPSAPPETQTQIYWAKSIAAGHLHDGKSAQDAVAEYAALLDGIRKGDHAYIAESTSTKVGQGEMQSWLAFATGDMATAEQLMRTTADLQDKVGQDEVDIPAREMLADMLLEWSRPKEALVEYEQALKLSPNRFNGLFNAGIAAERAGDKASAVTFYRTLLKSTDNGAHSARAEFTHVRDFVNSMN